MWHVEEAFEGVGVYVYVVELHALRTECALGKEEEWERRARE